jgi:hypothetical protein
MAVHAGIYSLLCKYAMVVGVFQQLEFHYLSSLMEDLDFGGLLFCYLSFLKWMPIR